MCISRNNPPTPTHRGSMAISKGRGVANATVFKEKYRAKLEFVEGWGCNFRVCGYFLGMSLFPQQVLTQETLGKGSQERYILF